MLYYYPPVRVHVLTGGNNTRLHPQGMVAPKGTSQRSTHVSHVTCDLLPKTSQITSPHAWIHFGNSPVTGSTHFWSKKWWKSGHFGGPPKQLFDVGLAKSLGFLWNHDKKSMLPLIGETANQTPAKAIRWNSRKSRTHTQHRSTRHGFFGTPTQKPLRGNNNSIQSAFTHCLERWN